MFQKLKIRLVLINMALVSAVIIIGFFAVYAVTKRSNDQQSEIIMHGIAKYESVTPDINAQVKNNENPGNPLDNLAGRILTNTFYVKITKSGEVIEYSNNLVYDKNETENTVKQAIEASRPKGFVKAGNFTWKYIKVEKEYGYILVFLDMGIQNSIFNRLLITSAIIGLISLIFILFISIYLSNKAVKPIKISWEKQNAFIADVSHELRTPLAVVNSNLEIVMENKAETVQSQSKWLENVQSEISRMTKLVEDLLFLAREDMNEEEMMMAPFVVSNSIDQTIDTFKPLLYKKNINLVSEIQPDLIVKGNEGRIKQLTVILIDNAINHTKQGGQIYLSLQQTEDFYEIVVSDNGEGIPKKDLDKIFERFYRVDKSRSRIYGGTGLGLSIAKCIVAEHKGSISTKSEVGKGTEFRVAMPVNSI